MTNIDRVLDLIRQHPEGLDDDEITELSGIHPRQQIYQIRTRLAGEGRSRRVSLRKAGKRRKLRNLPLEATCRKGIQVNHDGARHCFQPLADAYLTTKFRGAAGPRNWPGSCER